MCAPGLHHFLLHSMLPWYVIGLCSFCNRNTRLQPYDFCLRLSSSYEPLHRIGYRMPIHGFRSAAFCQADVESMGKHPTNSSLGTHLSICSVSQLASPHILVWVVAPVHAPVHSAQYKELTTKKPAFPASSILLHGRLGCCASYRCVRLDGHLQPGFVRCWTLFGWHKIYMSTCAVHS